MAKTMDDTNEKETGLKNKKPLLTAVPKPIKKEKGEKKPIKKKKKSERKKLTDDCFALWSKIISLNWKGKCAMCGKSGNQAHHFFGRKAYPSVKFDPDNGVLLCFYCHFGRVHQQGDVEPVREALIKKIGTERFERLKSRAYSPVEKMTMVDLRETKESLSQLLLSTQGTSSNSS